MTNSQAKISAEALDAFRKHTPEIIRKIVARSMRREEEIAAHGDSAERLVTAGIEWTFRMLDSAMDMGEASILDGQLEWARIRLPHDNVAPAHIQSRLGIAIEVIRDTLRAEHAAEVVPFLDRMMEYQKGLMEDRS